LPASCCTPCQSIDTLEYTRLAVKKHGVVFALALTNFGSDGTMLQYPYFVTVPVVEHKTAMGMHGCGIPPGDGGLSRTSLVTTPD
ncbi:MAG: hypothetical protein M0Z50_07660, partial [Planctomycetia bacterium]|nr:hypothetical protein [Planctomycetia bacterium]